MDDFEEEFKRSLADPVSLEALFRRDRSRFSDIIRHMEATGENYPLMAFWRARIDYRTSFDFKMILGLIALAFLCWIPTRIFLEVPTTGNENLLRYFASLFFACWGAAVMLMEHKIRLVLPMLALSGLVAILFRILPLVEHSQSRQMAVFHSYLLLWCSVPFAMSQFRILGVEYGRNYIEKTGESLCWATLFLIGGIVLTGVTIGLFNALDLQIFDFYFKNIVTFGLILAPFLGLYFAGDSIEIKISNILAKIFAPLAAATVTVFLITALTSYGKLFAEKDAFIFYSIVPIFIVAIIFFVNSKEESSIFALRLNLYLSAITAAFIIMVIPPTIYRISSWGITPNKATILGIEILLLLNMISILANQVSVFRKKKKTEAIADSIVQFLPIYLGWSFVVVAVFPVLFGFK